MRSGPATSSSSLLTSNPITQTNCPKSLAHELPANWGNRRRDRRIRLTWALQRARLVTRLAQIAYQHEQSSKPDDPLSFLRAYKPRAAAIQAIPNLKSVWRARTTEQLQQALDDAQDAIFEALESKDPEVRLRAAKLMLRTREARQRGWS
jgi:hypothetical protein